MMIDLVSQYAEGTIAGVERRQAERAIDPPEPKEPSARACRDAADAFDAGDALALDWLADHWRDDVTREFGMAALALERALRLPMGRTASVIKAEDAAAYAYEALRAAFVDQMAGEYE